MDHRADCAVVVVTYNSARHIGRFLESVDAAAGDLTCRVIVVDNFSTDHTVEAVAGHPAATCVALTTNLGYAAAINAGRRTAGTYSTLLVANPDVWLAPGCIELLHKAVTSEGHGAAVPVLTDTAGAAVRSLRREPSVGRQLGESLLGDHLPGRPAWLSELIRDERSYRRDHVVEWATGAVVMVSEACDRQVGEWNESYFLFSEEVEYASRIRSSGYTIAFVPAAVAEHGEGGSGRETSLLGLVAVNRLRYYRGRHGRARSLLYALAILLGLIVRAADPHHRSAAATLARASVPGVAWNRFPTGSPQGW